MRRPGREQSDPALPTVALATERPQRPATTFEDGYHILVKAERKLPYGPFQQLYNSSSLKSIPRDGVGTACFLLR